jgi:hypothetical protein
MIKKIIIGSVIAAVVVGGLVAAVVFRPIDDAPSMTNNTPSRQDNEDDEPTDETTLSKGRYVTYSDGVVREGTYTDTILFFHASWCPECRAFEQAIESGAIPDGVQILKVDYDNSDSLKSAYSVTLQSTFVKVNANGEKLSSWVGYGKDKSINAVLENT